MNELTEQKRIHALEQPRIDPASVIGWAVDADPSNDPTYPMRTRAGGDDQGKMTWERPTLQPPSVEVLQSTEHNRRTAVFGTSTPPHGVSGAIRRQAFHASEGKWSHWLMLLFADRINVVEGIVEDLEHGHVPNVLGEMGIRSEIRHNLPGLGQKVLVAGLVAAVGYVAIQSMRQSSARRQPE